MRHDLRTACAVWCAACSRIPGVPGARSWSNAAAEVGALPSVDPATWRCCWLALAAEGWLWDARRAGRAEVPGCEQPLPASRRTARSFGLTSVVLCCGYAKKMAWHAACLMWPRRPGARPRCNEDCAPSWRTPILLLSGRHPALAGGRACATAGGHLHDCSILPVRCWRRFAMRVAQWRLGDWYDLNSGWVMRCQRVDRRPASEGAVWTAQLRTTGACRTAPVDIVAALVEHRPPA